ncbi:Hypp9776 [Branchiostoma lanceolatum]|uniref:Hypp9776 protein n=1 Tax=Branchiostoma lanceolatum TaxID=7740 RepID=A0A8S4MPF7_BRALA|nr:Hypp9776 [Branchiostoma lanceolatum]
MREGATPCCSCAVLQMFRRSGHQKLDEQNTAQCSGMTPPCPDGSRPGYQVILPPSPHPDTRTVPVLPQPDRDQYYIKPGRSVD